MVQVYELPDSRHVTTGENPSVELHLNVEGTDDDFLAKAALLGAVPVIYDGLLRTATTLEPAGPDLWMATVQYTKKKAPEIGDCEISFDTGGGTQHITQSLRTVAKHAPPGKVAPENYGAIGVTKDSVEGVDIVVPVFNWSERYTVNPAMITWAYAVTCAYLTGRTNQSPFRGFAAAEVLFMGASCTARITGTAEQPELSAEVTYRFAASPNVQDLEVGEMQEIAKRGWEYMWVKYVDGDDQAANQPIKKPIAVYIEQVYREGNFGALGIGS